MPVDWQTPGDGASLSAEQRHTVRGSLCAVMSDIYDWDAWLIWNRHVSALPGIDVEQDAEPGPPLDDEDR
jgi:hypothetical protein